MLKKYLGQNFLFDPSILHRIIDVSGVTHNDLVVEIGPGFGRLTKMLAEAAKKVIAIELDSELFKKLKDELKEFNNIELVNEDVLKYPFEKLEPFKVVSNIPYYITTPIIFRLLEARKNLISMTLTIQKEVAERIVAKPDTKDYGVLTLSVQYYTEPEIKFIIPKGAFRPIPKVDSAVIRMEMLKKPRVKISDQKLFFRIIKAGFAQRRKTLANALKPIAGDVKEILIKAGIEPLRRAETLTIEEFAGLTDVIKEAER
jgi:16S rRNA (adenine1518-N6/adenine1519-N6)-dimethyltransferase